MTDDRGASEVLGVVLLLGLTMLAVTSVVVLGSQSLDQAQQEVFRERSELVADAFHDSVVSASSGHSGTASLDLGGVQATTRSDSGWVRVTRNGSKEVLNRSLGSVVFGDGTTDHVAYQAGAVFRTDDGQTTRIHDPSLRYWNGTLTLTLLDLAGDTSTDGRLSLTTNPDSGASVTQSWSNPVEDTTFTVTIQSEFYRAWGEYIAEGTPATPFYFGNETVTATFGPGRVLGNVTAGVVSGAPSSTLELTQGFAADSYNSTVGPYDGSAGAGKVVSAGDVLVNGGASVDGELRTGGDLTVTGGGQLDGSVNVSGDLTVDGGGSISAAPDGGWVGGDAAVDWGSDFDGTLHYQGDLDDPGDNVENSTQQPVAVDVTPPDAIGDYVDSTVDLAAGDNDNGETTAIDGDQLTCIDGWGETCTLERGTYYLDSLALLNDNLVFDTASGDITLVVNGDVRIQGSTTVSVEGEGRVNVVATGDFDQEGGATVTNDDDDATRLWLYLQDDASAMLEGGGEFVGVIYGPGGDDPGAYIEPSVPIYGALVGDITFAGEGVPIHYDHALTSVRPVPVDETAELGDVPLDRYTAPVDFAHVRTVSLNVTAG